MDISITTEYFDGYIDWRIDSWDWNVVGSCERSQRYSSWKTHTTTCCLSPGLYLLYTFIQLVKFDYPTTSTNLPVSAYSKKNPQWIGGFFTIQGQRYMESLDNANWPYKNLTILGKAICFSPSF